MTAVCALCGWKTVADRQWRKLSQAERNRLSVEGYVRRYGSGMCDKCAKRAARSRDGDPMRGVHVDPDVIREEWLWLANPWRTDAENIEDLAPRLGMSKPALERAIQRLRSKGLVDPARKEVA